MSSTAVPDPAPDAGMEAPLPWRRWHTAWRRWSLWTLLVALVVSMLITLVWLAGRYEASQVQSRLERDTADAVADIRMAFSHNLQSLQALQANGPDLASWESRAAELLSARRELVRVEWRDSQLRIHAHAETPYRPMHWDAEARSGTHSDIAMACSNARLKKKLDVDTVKLRSSSASQVPRWLAAWRMRRYSSSHGASGIGCED